MCRAVGGGGGCVQGLRERLVYIQLHLQISSPFCQATDIIKGVIINYLEKIFPAYGTLGAIECLPVRK